MHSRSRGRGLIYKGSDIISYVADTHDTDVKLRDQQ